MFGHVWSCMVHMVMYDIGLVMYRHRHVQCMVKYGLLWSCREGCPDMHESCQNPMEKIYVSLYGIKMASTNFQSFRSSFTIPTKPLLFLML